MSDISLTVSDSTNKNDTNNANNANNANDNNDKKKLLLELKKGTVVKFAVILIVKYHVSVVEKSLVNDIFFLFFVNWCSMVA